MAVLAVEEKEVAGVLFVTETYDDGWAVSFRRIPIIENVEFVVYDDSQTAVLEINGQDTIEFAWSPEAEAMVESIDTAEPIELLELLSRLNRKLESDMKAVRQANLDNPSRVLAI